MTEITYRKKNVVAINTHLSILTLNVNELIKKQNQSFVATRDSSYLHRETIFSLKVGKKDSKKMEQESKQKQTS